MATKSGNATLTANPLLPRERGLRIAMDTGQKTESVVQLVDDIARGAVALPEFQRDFVWDIEKTFDLFDSFARYFCRLANLRDTEF